MEDLTIWMVLIKTEKIKKKDSYIVKSWVVNNSTNTDMATKHLRENVNISNTRDMAKKYSPFPKTDKNDETKFIRACVMLGGYKTNK